MIRCRIDFVNKYVSASIAVYWVMKLYLTLRLHDVYSVSLAVDCDVLWTVKLPDAVDYESAACCIEDGLRAYLAIHYLGHVSSGDTVLIMDAATAFGCLAVQLAHLWHAKVSSILTV